jgi:glucose dehydrogenase
MIPNGETPTAQQDAIRNHPLLQGVPNVLSNMGRQSHSALLATPGMLLSTAQLSDNNPYLLAIDKRTGRRLAQVQTPALGTYGIMTYMHLGKQYVILSIAGGYAAMALP